MSGELLLLQYSRQFQDIYNTNYSLFLHPNHHTKCLPYVEEWKLIDLVNGTVTTSLFGSTATFEIPTDGNIVGCMYLKIVVPALTANGASNVCLVDYAGWAMIRDVSVRQRQIFETNLSQRQIFVSLDKFLSPEINFVSRDKFLSLKNSYKQWFNCETSLRDKDISRR